MNKFYLRIEGVNLSSFVYETQDLSTIRGGGLLLLDAVKEVEELLRGKNVNAQAISTGASSGLFSFDAEKREDAAQICRDVRDFLNRDAKYRHATMMVDFISATDDFRADRETLLSLNRWQQMTAPGVAVPEFNEDEADFVCEIDFVRPAVAIETIKGGRKNVSRSVAERFKYGKEKKQQFVAGEINSTEEFKFSYDFDKLTDRKTKDNLHHKMCVIYMDGNNFGTRQTECKSAAELEAFDNRIKDYRRDWLTALMEKLKRERAEWISPEGLYQMEILQWGGDEIYWVLPAWKGWETLCFLFEQSKGWEYDGRLTHAAGMVFCHHNAPIRRVKNLACSLGELCKEKDRTKNLFAYEILESFDHVGRVLEKYRTERSPQPLAPDVEPDAKAMILPGDEMRYAVGAMKIYKELIPRRKLVEVVRLLLRKPKSAAHGAEIAAKADRVMKEVLSQIPAERKTGFGFLINSFGGDFKWWLDEFNLLSKTASDAEKAEHWRKRAAANPAWWLHLNELWDYID